jgi:serine/threonine protein kinase
MGGPGGRTPRPHDIDAWQLEYVRQLDEGGRDSPEEFVGRIADESLREAVLERLRLFARAYRALSVDQPSLDEPKPNVPGFRIEREIGHGGGGQVYFARSDRYPEGVAIKVLPFHGATGRERERVVHEYHVLAELDHPSIVRIFEMGVLPRAFYLVMEWVDGISLSSLVDALRGEDPEGVGTSQAATILARVWRRVSPLPAEPRLSGTYLDWVVDTFQSLASGLAQVHERGIVHRDITPSNVMIRRDGAKPVLLDFGLARRQGSPRVSATGDLVGKPHYVAPEHARGLRSGSNPRADVYALTSMLFEMVTLRHPFDGTSTRDILRNIARQAPPAPRRLNGAVRPELQTLILWGLEKAPSRRIPSARVLAEELSRLRAGERTLASRTRVLRSVRRTAHRLGSRTSVAISIACASVLIAISGWPGRGREPSAGATPARVADLPFLVGDVARNGRRVWVHALGRDTAIPVSDDVWTLPDGNGAIGPALAIGELDGTPGDEIVVVEDRETGWDVVAYDLRADGVAARLWSLMQSNPELATEIGSGVLEPGRIVCGDADGTGRTSTFVCVHDRLAPHTILLRIPPDGAAATRFELPGIVGDLPGSFYVDEQAGAPRCALVVAGVDASRDGAAFALVLDPASFPGELPKRDGGGTFRRGTFWIVPPSELPVAPASTLPVVAAFQIDGAGYLRVDRGGRIATTRCDETADRIFGSEGPASVESAALGDLRVQRATAGESAAARIAGRCEVHVRGFGFDVRDATHSPVAAARLVPRGLAPLRVKVLAHDSLPSSSWSPSTAVALSVAARPRENGVVLVDSKGRVDTRWLMARRSPLRHAERDDDQGIDAMEVVSLDAVRFRGASDPTWLVGASSRTRGALFFVDTDLSLLSEQWFPGPLADVAVRDADRNGSVVAMFRFAREREGRDVVALVEFHAIPPSGHLPLPGESKLPDRGESPNGLLLFTSSGEDDATSRRLVPLDRGWIARLPDGAELLFDAELAPLRPDSTADVRSYFDESPRLPETDPQLLRWTARSVR